VDGSTAEGPSRDQLVTPLLEKDLIEMTIPNSPLQKYWITQKGQNMVGEE
jgi:hypothetical protein